jgi:Tol biopolymer transport system component
LVWSPDGRWLVAPDKAFPHEPFGLFLLSVETGEKKRLTLPPKAWEGDTGAAFSPDGSLAFARITGKSVSELYLLALSSHFAPSGEPKQLTFDGRAVTDTVWSPNGKEIIFSSGQYGDLGLWRIGLDGSGKSQQLSSLGEEGALPTISRQARRLVYARSLRDENIWRADLVGDGREPNPPVKLISSTRQDWVPHFSPDGKRIAFQSDRSGAHEIWVCESDGSRTRQLTWFGKAMSGTPRWSPDAKHIAFDSNVEGQWDIHVISANGGKPRRLTSDASHEVVPSWSNDGKWIYFASNRAGDFQVWKMPANGGEAVQVTKKGGVVAFESTDGRWLYYTKTKMPEIVVQSSSLWKVALPGGEESQVLESILMRNFAVAAGGIYFIPEPGPGGSASIQFLNFASGESKRIIEINNPGWAMAASRDGRSLLWMQIDYEGDDLMLVENFR